MGDFRSWCRFVKDAAFENILEVTEMGKGAGKGAGKGNLRKKQLRNKRIGEDLPCAGCDGTFNMPDLVSHISSHNLNKKPEHPEFVSICEVCQESYLRRQCSEHGVGVCKKASPMLKINVKKWKKDTKSDKDEAEGSGTADNLDADNVDAYADESDL